MEGSEMLEACEEEERVGALSRAKSDLSLLMNGLGEGGRKSELAQSPARASELEQRRVGGERGRPASLAVSTESSAGGVAKALYAYLSSGDNQLSFLEGDIIMLIGKSNKEALSNGSFPKKYGISLAHFSFFFSNWLPGERSKGWQFGENLRTQKTGWFPVAYTQGPESPAASPMTSCDSAEEPGPPPLPPPTPAGHQNLGKQMRMERSQLTLKGMTPKSPQLISTSTSTQTPATDGRASDSLTSSNDSGFSNDLHKAVPPQPEVDYSEDEPQLSSR